jgi:hypothetical protein
LSLFTTPKITYKTSNSRPNNNKNIITVVSGAVVFVVMNIIVKARRGSGVHNARRRKLPRDPSLKEKASLNPFLPFRPITGVWLTKKKKTVSRILTRQDS